MANRILIEEARATAGVGDTVSLGVERFPRDLKRQLALRATNESTTIREVLIRAVEREFAGPEPANDVPHPDDTRG